jgi:sensor histidine kinase YesM
VHPILASRTRLAFYLGFWVVVALLLAVVYATASAASGAEALVIAAPLVVIYGFICLSAWYVCRVAPLSLAGIGRVVVTQLLASGVATILWLPAWEGWTYTFLGPFDQAVANYRSQLPFVVSSGVLLYASAAMFHYVLIAAEASQAAVTRGFSLEVMAREAELKALRAQIDPHFLFNSLNSISALTTTDPRGARDMCVLLAAFFRNSVRLGNEDEVPLGQELELVGNYLEIEKIRCGARLTTRVDVAPDCESCLVPPLILQPLVENAVRHGIHSLTSGGYVEVRATCAERTLVLCVENPFDTDAAAKRGAGVGLANVKQRVRALYGRDADLRTSASQGLYRAELRLPCRGAAGGAAS